MNQEFLEFLRWIRQIGSRADLVQGGGGNFSFKIDGRLMAIKASGSRFSEASEKKGLAFIDYPTVSDFLEERMSASEAESVNFIASRVLADASGQKRRPSMEIGFHVFLPRYVVHVHSVYANILACAENGEAEAEKFLAKLPKPILWLPYYQPGWILAGALKKAVDDFSGRHGFLPEVIFLQNHGLILTGDNWRWLADLNGRIENILKEKLPETFPAVKIGESNGFFAGDTSYLANFLEVNREILENFENNIIFPDQAVFCQDFGKKIIFDNAKSQFVYKTGFFEALAIEETLTAWAFILSNIREVGGRWLSLPPAAVNSLVGMESEKYRKRLMAEEKR